MCAPLGSRLRCMLPVRARRCFIRWRKKSYEHHSANRFAAVYANDTCGYPTLLKDLEQARELGYTVDKESMLSA